MTFLRRLVEKGRRPGTRSDSDLDAENSRNIAAVAHVSVDREPGNHYSPFLILPSNPSLPR
jgi:hypothetical protein